MTTFFLFYENEGGCGQLGNGAYSSSTTPQVVHGPWISPSGEPSFPKKVDNDKKYNVLGISKISKMSFFSHKKVEIMH